MEVDFLAQQGELAFASRLRRLSDTVANQAAAVYRRYGLEFDPKCFPIFRLLSEQGPLSVTVVAEKLGVSHPAVIQVARELERQELIISEKPARDARKRLLRLSEAGQEKLPEFHRIWQLIREVNENLIQSQRHNILWAVEELEMVLSEKDYLTLFTEHLKNRQQEAIDIVDFQSQYRNDFKRLNLEWIERYFKVETHDLEQLDQPEEIIAGGGFILVALLGSEVIGTVGMVKDAGQTSYEMVKMAIAERAQGRQAGKKLGLAAIERARQVGATHIWLESNTKLMPALELYRKLGFYKVEMAASLYERANIKMQLDL